MPAIHPRVIAQSSFFGLLTRHSQSFKLTLVPHLFSPRTSFTFLFSTYCLFQTVQFPPVSAMIARSSFFGLLTCHSQSFKLTLVPHLFSPCTSFTFLFSAYRPFQTVQFPPVSAAVIPVFHRFKLTCSKWFVLHLSFSCFPSISNRTVCTHLLPLRRPVVIAVCHHFQLASL